MVTHKIFNGFLALIITSGILGSSMVIHCSQEQQGSAKEGARWECDTCDDSYVHKSGLPKHKRVCQNKAVNEKFTCKQCGDSFYFDLYLKRHMAVHGDEKNYLCEVDGCNIARNCSRELCSLRKNKQSRQGLKRLRTLSVQKRVVTTKKQKKDKESVLSIAALNKIFDGNRIPSKQEIDVLDAAVFASVVEVSRANSASSVKVDKIDLLQII